MRRIYGIYKILLKWDLPSDISAEITQKNTAYSLIINDLIGIHHSKKKKFRTGVGFSIR